MPQSPNSFAMRRSAGCWARRRRRAPMTMWPGKRWAAASRRGMSPGLCWPSPSMLSTPSKPRSQARRKPSRSASPLPRRTSWRISVIGRSWMRSTVASVEPSSTTMTFGQCASAPSTTSRMRSSSFRAGISTATRDTSGAVACSTRSAFKPRPPRAVASRGRPRAGRCRTRRARAVRTAAASAPSRCRRGGLKAGHRPPARRRARG